MNSRFKCFKLICGTLTSLVLLFFTVVGMHKIWTEHVIKGYDKHFTEQAYVDVAVNQNVNLVFYRRGCPYCEASKKAVIAAAEESPYPTFYIDVESEEGQALVKKYRVEKAASLVIVRDGKSNLYIYATKNKNGQIKANQETIKEMLDNG